MIWILRGGGTDVYTLISKLARLQKLIPNNHLSDSQPYIMADSAGAYPGSGLVVPNPVDPIQLPDLFIKNINRYLARDRAEADAALIEEIGPLRINQAALPICISTTEITERLEKAYFRHFPSQYTATRGGLLVPPNANDDVQMSHAVLASSAFAAFLGDYQIGPRRFMDMAFLENHSSNLAQFAMNHARTCPDRRLVCVVFGNIYKDFRIGKGESLNVKGLNRHFADAVRTYVQDDLLQLAESLLGPDNVFDMSMYIEQPFSARLNGPKSHAFSSKPAAIRERVQWTDAILDNDPRQQAQLEKLADLIKRSALPAVSIAPRAVISAEPSYATQPLTQRERLEIVSQNYGITAGLAFKLAHDHLSPAINRVTPVLKTGKDLVVAGGQFASNWINTQWTNVVSPRLDMTGERAYHFLMTGSHAPRKPRDATQAPATPPSLPHSSELHTPSESGHMPL